MLLCVMIVRVTGEIAGALGAVVVRHERNLGCGAAIGSLFREALGFSGKLM